MARHFEPWVRRMLANENMSGWIISDGERDIASAGFLVLDWAPHFLDPAGEQRGYVLNVFVEPEYRRRGLAQALMSECMDEARRRGIRVVALHASEEGTAGLREAWIHDKQRNALSLSPRKPSCHALLVGFVLFLRLRADEVLGAVWSPLPL